MSACRDIKKLTNYTEERRHGDEDQGCSFNFCFFDPFSDFFSYNANAYDATGTWNYTKSNTHCECLTGPIPDYSWEIKITQYGNLISIEYERGTKNILSGSVAGNRYQAFGDVIHASGLWPTTIIFDLNSANVGKGYFLTTDTSNCLYSSNFDLQRQGTCTPSDTVMCLQNGRFSVSVNWEDQQGNKGVGTAIPSTDDSGLFWFFSPSNMELLIKVLDGCGINNKYWVFFAATTDQKFTVTVVDLQTGQQVEYTNPLKNPADAITDTSAFASCP